jgi:hypothetical protein
MNIETRRKFIEITKRRIKPGSGSTTTFLRTHTWTQSVTNLSNLITVPYVIVGGVATRLYMPERMTLDLAILIHSDRATELYTYLKTKAILVGELSIGGTSWQLPDQTILDILSDNKPWVNKALEQPQVSPDGQPVIDLPYLILMKLAASHTTDISDISRMLGQASELQLERVKSVIETYDRESLEDLESLIQLGQLEFGID